jgi:hypothetical protein
MPEPLKVCPSCGTSDWIYSQPQFFRVVQEGTRPFGWVTMCNHCGLKVEGYTKAETEAKWNRRTVEDALAAACLRVKVYLEAIGLTTDEDGEDHPEYECLVSALELFNTREKARNE